jgi:hypothetical protein
MGNGCAGATSNGQPVWGFMDEEQRNNAIQTDPNEAGKLIDLWFADKWNKFKDKLPEVDEEELQGNLGWIRFLQFQDEVFTARDLTWTTCMEKYGKTDAEKCKIFLRTYVDHLVYMCEAFNPNLSMTDIASAAHILPACKGRSQSYEHCVAQVNDYLNTLSEYSELSESYKFKQDRLKALYQKSQLKKEE